MEKRYWTSVKSLGIRSFTWQKKDSIIYMLLYKLSSSEFGKVKRCKIIIYPTLMAWALQRGFLALDLWINYKRVEIEPLDNLKHKRSFFYVRVMPFGRWNVAAKFERLMVTAIAKLDWKICLIYLDYRKYQTCNVVITTDDKKIDLTKQTLGRH